MTTTETRPVRFRLYSLRDGDTLAEGPDAVELVRMAARLYAGLPYGLIAVNEDGEPAYDRPDGDSRS